MTNAEVLKVAKRNNPEKPSRLGKRFSASAFLPEAGNTVICPLDTDHPAHAAVLKARAWVQALPGAERVLFTPASSLHMTVFEGAIESRRTADAWPEDLSRQAPIDAVTTHLVQRLKGFVPPPAFAVRVAGIGPNGLMLKGAAAQDESALLAWREALTKPFGYRHGAHDSYRFHMTFGYSVDWLSDREVPIWDEALASILADLIADAPVLPLKAPVFCKFADMTRFDELVYLRG